MSIHQIKEMIENAEAIIAEPPMPLRKAARPASNFPLEALPCDLKEAILGVHDKIQAPIPICAQSALAAITLAVQGLVNVKLPTGQSRPVINYFMTIAESGERKTSCDKEFSRAIEEYEEQLRSEYNAAHLKWRNEYEIWESARTSILKPKGSTIAKSDIDKLNALGEEPKPPLQAILTAADPTFEGLCKLMLIARPSLGIFSSEGGQFIGGYGMKDDNKVKTVAALSSMWDGDPIKRVRSGDGSATIAGRRVCIHLMVQPDMASKFLSDNTLRDQGILSRMLVVSPKTASGTRFYKQVKDESIVAIDRFNDKIKALLNFPLPLKPGCDNELKPDVIALDTEAVNAYYTFADQIESLIGPGGSLETIKGFANKAAEHAARIAAILAIFEDPNTRVVSNHYFKMAVTIVCYYIEEIRRLTDAGYVSPNILKAEKVLDWLHHSWGKELVSLPDIYQNVSYAKTADAAREVVGILVAHGWLVRCEDQIILKKQRRKEVWRIVRPAGEAEP